MSAEKFHHVRLLIGHGELTWFLAEDETHEAVLAVGCAPTNALVTTNGKLDTFCHVAPFVCTTMPTRCDIRASGMT
jgi:hypothetical protein